MKNLKLFILLITFISINKNSLGQLGTLTNPFTSISQSLYVTSNGIYYFNLSGTLFSTYVDSLGYVLIAIDYGDGNGDLPQTSNLTFSSRGILDSLILLNLTSITEAKINDNTNFVNVLTYNSFHLNNIKNNKSLHSGILYNTQNDSWIGTNSYLFTDNASCIGPENRLHKVIFHPCGNFGGFHWLPWISQQRLIYDSGDINSSGKFMLWVRESWVPLPLNITYFNSYCQNDKKYFEWESSFEIENDFYTLEKSKDGITWEFMLNVSSIDNSLESSKYLCSIENEYVYNYFRLKQTNLDGEEKVCKVIFNDCNNNSQIFPNPFINEINITNFNQNEELHIYNNNQTEITDQITFKLNNNLMSLDFKSIASGLYYVKYKNKIHKVIKL